MLNLETSLNSNNNAAGRRQPTFVNNVAKSLLTLAVATFMATGAAAATAAPAQAVRAPVLGKIVQLDPLAGDTWHADTPNGTWPGTLVFDGAKKNVTLSPVGATPMQAAYTYTVKPSSAGQVVEGTLRMTTADKQVSDSTFRIQGRVLTLSYSSGQRPETYVRMTPKEESAEKARLQKMISEGRIRPLK